MPQRPLEAAVSARTVGSAEEKALKSTGNHIGKGCDDKKRKQPAEQQEQLAAEAAKCIFQ